MASSNFLGHSPCPNCGSRDNLGNWEDGKWCFGCGYRLPKYKGLSLKDLRQSLEQQEKRGSKYANLRLPSDFSYDLPEQCRQWLSKYGLTNREISQHRFGWSAEYECLIFPVFDIFGNLLAWQGRSFRQKPENVQRYNSRGDLSSIYHIIGTGGNTVVCVEDLVSAIKVSRLLPAMPLWGSQMPIDRIRKLSGRFSRLVLWLDHDKQRYALQARFRALPYFDDVKVVITELDPKGYSDIRIKEYLL